MKKIQKTLIKIFILTLLIVPSYILASPALANLIENPNLDIVDSINTNTPKAWFTGSVWGSNIPVYDYSTTSKNISSSFETYTGSPDIGGDAKWYFAPVSVVPGRQYVFSDRYTSNTTSYLTAEFLDSNNNHISYGGFFTINPTPDNTWASTSVIFTVPSGTSYMTVFHSIQSVGKLTTDNYSLEAVPLPGQFDKGFVSLSFDDGYIDNIKNAKPILDKLNMKGTFYVVSHLSGFSVLNPSFEIPDSSNANQPLGWTPASIIGSTNVYPVAGYNSGKAIQTNSKKTGTHAGWNFNPITILTDQDFVYSDYYKSSTNSSIYIKVIKNTNEIKYIKSNGDETSTPTPFANLPKATNWTKYAGTFYIFPGTKSVSVLHAIEGIGSLTIDNVNLGAFTDYANQEQIKSLQSSGHEVSAHTQTHADLINISNADADIEISGSKMDLLNGGILNVDSLAYPYGNFNESVKTLVKNAGFKSARTVSDGYNGIDSDKFALLSKSVNRDTTLKQVQTWIDESAANKLWLILVFHQVQNAVASDPNLTYGTTPKMLTDITNYIKIKNVGVKTISAGVASMN